MESKHINTEFFDLSSIYNIGRSHSVELSKAMEIFQLSSAEKDSLDSFTTQLTNFLNSDSSQRFNPFFIELSLYEPTDIEGSTFYSLYISKEDAAFDCYQSEMNKNIIARMADYDSLDRGIIIPNPYLYNSPYFHYPVKSSIKVCNLSEKKFSFNFGYFRDPRSKKPFQKFDFLQDSIVRFFKDIISSFETIQFGDKEGDQLNTVILIPLYRPVSTLSTVGSQAVSMFKGGGVFLYGSTEKNFNIYQFIVELSSVLTKSIFRQAFSQIEEEVIKDKLSNIELDTFHYLRNRLQQLPHYLGRIRRSIGKIPVNDIQNSIGKAETYISNVTENALLMLSAYRLSMAPAYSRQSYKVSDLGKLLKKLKDRESSFLTFKLNEELIDKFKIIEPKISNESLSKELRVHPDSLFGVIISYIQNSAQAYQKNNNGSINGLSITFSIAETQYLDFEALEFKIFNSGTQISNSIMDQLGITPIESDNSSGLGFIFIGKTLKIIGAIKDSNYNRFFHLENVADGVVFSFKIRI